jgi:hypothetical protein
LNHWVAIQSAYYKRLKSQRTSHTWACNLIQRLWEVSWNMWQNCNHILYNVHTESNTSMALLLSITICCTA